jgi:formamidopyrimidine-DNA glycosylase
MPELPEVEVCRRELEPTVQGRVISGVVTSKAKNPFLTAARVVRERLTGQRILGIGRRGKYLLFALQDARGAASGTLLVHLGMTGQLVVGTKALGWPGNGGGVPTDPHIHLLLELEGCDSPVLFRDPRQFGKIALLPGDAARHPRLARLGPDALGMEGDALFSAARGRKTTIKAVLLDQTNFAGIGNIYADEALFRSGVRPSRPAHKLTKAEAGRLAYAVRTVLMRAIEVGGSSVSDYLHPDGSSGYFQIEHAVYDRSGEPCRICWGVVKKTVVAQRGTHFCPRCQR